MRLDLPLPHRVAARSRSRQCVFGHGGVLLDISYLPADRVRRKLPSMHEQFKELADVDITTSAMEFGFVTLAFMALCGFVTVIVLTVVGARVVAERELDTSIERLEA